MVGIGRFGGKGFLKGGLKPPLLLDGSSTYFFKSIQPDWIIFGKLSANFPSLMSLVDFYFEEV
jgi:hypothetical protein